MSKKFTSNHDGSRNSSIDGTGILASVTPEVATNMLNFLKNNEKFKNTYTILDVGAGQGYFQKCFEDSGLYEVWSVEGSSEVPFSANLDRRITADFTKDLSKEFANAFDLVVSFECIEHVPEDLQKKFWDNVFKCSDRALVGIHCSNEEDEKHCFIRPTWWWKSYFIKNNIILEEVYSTPGNCWESVAPWECSFICLLKKG